VSIARPVVFPLFPILQTANGPACACGNASCSRIGKHPAVEWGKLKYGDPVPRPEPGAGAGLITGAHPHGSDVWVADLDGIEAQAEYERRCLESGEPPPETYTVATGRDDGLQLYFQLEDFPIPGTARQIWWNGKTKSESQAIDSRGEGGYVVVPGSPHKSGRTYRVVKDVPPARAPKWLVCWLRNYVSQHKSSPVQSYAGDVADEAERAYRRDLFAKYLKTAPPCIEGGGGDQRLFEVVQHGAYDLALPTADVLELIREHFDRRCVPPWGDELDERVQHKAHSAKTTSTRPRAEPLPRDLGHLVLEMPPPPSLAPTAPSAADPPPTKPPLLPIIWGQWDEPTVPPVYLLQGLIPVGKVCTFFAEGGSVKTWAAFGLGIAVATGDPWLDEYIVQKGRALFLDYEDGREEFKRRLGILRPGTSSLPDLGYLYSQAALLNPDTWKFFATLGLKLIIIDSISAATPAQVDENNREFAETLKLAGLFTSACPDSTVLFIHHANKTGGMRGSSAIRDQSDVVFRFEPVSETDSTKRMRMVCDKPGPQKRPAPVNIELSDGGLRTFQDEVQQLGRNATKPEDLRKAILLAIGQRGPISTRHKVRAEVGGRLTRVTEELDALVKEGEVVYIDEVGGYQLDSDEKRLARVLACVRRTDEYFTSPAALAKAAYVKTRFVESLERKGVVCGSGEGRLMEVSRDA